MLKIVFDKNGHHVRIEVTTDTAKKPVVIELTQAQLSGIMAALVAVQGADRLKFNLEM